MVVLTIFLNQVRAWFPLSGKFVCVCVCVCVCACVRACVRVSPPDYS